MAAQKEAMAVVLDVGPSMDQAAPGETTALETAVDVVTMVLQRKMFAESKDEVALVLFGTEETDNHLASSDSDSYKHISIARPLGIPDFDLLQMVQEDVQPTNRAGDFLDALVVALDHLVKSTEGKRGFGSKRIILLSDLGAPFSDDQVDTIMEAMQSTGTELNVIGPYMEDDDDEDEDRKPNVGEDGAGPSTSHRKPLTAQQRAGQSMVRHILNTVEGEAYSFSEALPALSHIQARQIKQVAWKCQLEVGSKLKIPICAYTKVKEYKLKQSWKKVYARDEDLTVGNLRTHHRNDEEETEVEKEDMAEGFRYGKDIIPMTADDKENMKYRAEKCLKLLGFTKAENVKRHHYLGDGSLSVVAEKDDEAAAAALSALIHALHDTDCVAIARRVYSAASGPKLGALIPHIKVNYQCLMWVELPFAEDLRQFTFGALPVSDETTFSGNKKFAPTDAQLQAMNRLISETDLSQAVEDEDGDKEEAFKPKLTFNPYFQRVYQCLQHRALNPDEPLPELSPLIAASLEPPQQVAAACQENAERLSKLFKLEVIAKKKEEKTGENVFKSSEASNGEPSAKRQCLDNNLEGGLADLTKAKVTEVGTATPIEDFMSLISRKNEDLFEQACKQMQKRLEEIVMGSFGTQFYSKALDCLKALRRECVNKSEPKLYNDFVRSFKETLVSKAKRDFWDKLVLEKQGLISKPECEDSRVTKEEAEKFTAEDEIKKEEEENEEEETAEDLLEMM